MRTRGRLYLPRELLNKHGILEDDPKKVMEHPAVGHICDELADIAEDSFGDAVSAMKKCSRKTMRPALVMMYSYLGILRRLRSAWLE